MTDPAAELRVYPLVEGLRPRFAAYLGTPARRAQFQIEAVLGAVEGR